MSSKDIWGDIEIDMLRAGIEQLEADKTRLLEQNSRIRMCLNMIKSKAAVTQGKNAMDINELCDIALKDEK